MISFSALSHLCGAILFLAFTALLSAVWQGRERGALMVFASAVTTLWCTTLAVHAAFGSPSLSVLQVLEILRDAAWLALLLDILGITEQRGQGIGRGGRVLGAVVTGACIAQMGFVLVPPYLESLLVTMIPKGTMVDSGYVLLAAIGLVMVAQVYRRTPPQRRKSTAFACIGIGGIFAYDVCLYVDALWRAQVDPTLWAARGAVHAFAVPLLAVAAARNPEWSPQVFLSRQFVGYFALLLGIGSYMALVAGAGYYILGYGGPWSTGVIAVSLPGALALLLVLSFSRRLHAQASVFISKHFFRSKYDYRKEWLRFTHILSSSRPDIELKQNIVRAIASLVASPGGVIWFRQNTGAFLPVAQWRATFPEAAIEPGGSSLVRFLERDGWAIYLDEYAHAPTRYQGLQLPPWLHQMRQAWIVVPLLQRSELLGFIVLMRAPISREFNWEDSDLLKTVGRQAASYLALLNASEALAEARQFEVFSRLSSYVVHDLKNLVAQLSLVISNAQQHHQNPAFMEDTIDTVVHAVGRMKRLLTQLQKGHLNEVDHEKICLRPLLQSAVKRRAQTKPLPALEHCPHEAMIVADPERLTAIIEHMIQNAQEATPPEGKVTIRLREDLHWAIVEIEDTGIGMDAQFVAERLFRPFDSTKGQAGMGIGMHQAREFLRTSGGDISVNSTPGCGTVVCLQLPLADGPETAPYRPLSTHPVF